MVQAAGDELSAERGGQRRGAAAFWMLGGMLLLYVAVCTGQRDNMWESDAWEHHRVVLALEHDPWHPGNPTFATDDPSIRYSPWALGLAWVARTTGADAYSVLGAAAVANTLLLLLGVRRLLASFGEERAASCAVLVMVCLYGGAPGYANSWALSDLPWQQVNPSAFGFPLCLIAWSVAARLRGGGDARGTAWRWLAVAVLLALALLSHAMTGVLGFVGLAALLAVTTPAHRGRFALGMLLAAGAALLLCAAWPLFDFLRALRPDANREYWFNGAILAQMLTRWCLPALIAALCALPLLHRDLVRFCALAGLACLLLGLAAAVLRSASLARLPLPGVLFPQLMVAVVLADAGVLNPRTWPTRLAGLRAPDLDQAARPILETLLCLGVVCFAVPQVSDIVQQPWLARGLIAPLLGKEDKQLNLKARFDRLLAGVGVHDVVLSDPVTSWPVPSSNGRIVTALHYEYFVPDQAERAHDVAAFFGATTEAARADILRRWNVRWILLNRAQIGESGLAALLVPQAVVARDGDLQLMDAARWLAARP